MHCLRCRARMQKRPLRGVLTDYCVDCDSIWLDAGELEALLEGSEIPPSELEAMAARERARERRKRVEVQGLCPRCQGQLRIDRTATIEVDRCLACRGTFFDSGELPEVFARLRPGRIARVWARARRRFARR